MRHLIFTFLFVLRVFAGNQSLLNAQVSEELYAYLAMLPNGMVAIQAVNPRNLTQVSDLAMLPINGGEYVGNSYLSPTGNWLLFEVTTLSSQKLRLFNLLTGETIDMLEDVQVAESPPTLSGPPQNISWSLNGRYFAINYAVYETNRYGVYLYDTQTHTLTNLTMPDSNHFRLAWSNDSTQLATTSMICGVGECSRVAIDIFDAATGELTASIDVKNLSSGPGGQYTNFCQLTWSPSNTYIAFVDQCDNSLLGGRKEVSIASLNTFTVIQSTDFTPTNLPTQEMIFQAFYDISWADDSKLLIGAVFQEGVMSQSYEPRMPLTHIYNISNDTSHAVSAQQLGGWSRASATLFGYHAYIYPQNLTPTSFPVSANVVVSAFDGQSFNTVGSGPSGCHLAWNTEKTILAYVPEDVITLNNCSRNGTTIYFLNAVNGNLTSFSSGEGNAIALGWITLGTPACASNQAISAGDTATLLNAINTANSNPDADVIGLEAGTYPFTTAHIPLNALPAITSEITIIGNRATLTRQAGAPLFGFFEVNAGGSLTLENLTLNGGDVGNDTGGALVNEGGTVTLNNVTFTNNHANIEGSD